MSSSKKTHSGLGVATAALAVGTGLGFAFWKGGKDKFQFITQAFTKPEVEVCQSPKAWFTEVSDASSQQKVSLRIKEKLHDEQTPHQHIEVYDTGYPWGKVLVLDGKIKITEQYASLHYEILGHISALTHPEPKTVLVIGGGDVAIVKVLLHHPSITKVDICDMDPQVVEVAKTHFASMSIDIPDDWCYFEDAVEFVKQHTSHYDIIIVTSSYPKKYSSALHDCEFYEAVEKALTPEGVFVSECASPWTMMESAKTTITMCSCIFPVVEMASVPTASLPLGGPGFVFCTKTPSMCCSHCAEPVERAHKITDVSTYYDIDFHEDIFKLSKQKASELKCIVEEKKKDQQEFMMKRTEGMESSEMPEDEPHMVEKL